MRKATESRRRSAPSQDARGEGAGRTRSRARGRGKGPRGGNGGGRKRKSKKERKAEAAERERAQLAQDKVPLVTIEGSFVRRPDGKSNLIVWMQGTNDSLYTYAQKVEEARSLTAALVSIGRPFSILKLPKAVDSNANLVHIDNEIERLGREIAAEGGEVPLSDPRQIRLGLLRERIRPAAEKEALTGDRFMRPTYIVVEYERGIPDESALSETRIFVDRLADQGRLARICGRDEVVEALQLFFTPRHVDVSAQAGHVPVMTRGSA